jgi:spermidine/putrescine transport system substrate-binding protein
MRKRTSSSSDEARKHPGDRAEEEERIVTDQELSRYLQRLAQTPLNRRGFLYASGLAATAAALAACGGSSATATPAPTTAPASTGPSAAPSATPAPTPVDVGKDLFMYNWSDYVAPDNIEAFKAAFGVDNFTYDTYASNEELMTKLQGGAKGQWDVAAPTAEFVPAMRDQSFIQKLDLSRIPNAKYIDKAFKGLWWDPTDEWQVPKDWGTTGIAVRTKVVKEEVSTWKQFLEIAPKYSGRIVIVDSPGDVFVAPLKSLGYSLNSVDPGELEQARKLLMALAPHVLALDSDQYAQKLQTEEAVLGLVWTGNILPMRDVAETKDTVYTIPADGTLFWMDTWTILADPPHLDAAYAFLNFIQEPEIQAKETESNYYATANDEAKKFVDPKILNDPAVFVPDDVMAKLEGAKDVSTDKLRVSIWEEFKSKIGS